MALTDKHRKQPQDPLRPPRSDRLGPGLAMALAVHVGLLIALGVSLLWRTQPEAQIMEAELWGAVPVAAAPTQAPVPAPVPVPTPPPPPPPKASPTPTPPKAEADLAEEAARKQKLKEAQEQAKEIQRQAALLKKQKQDEERTEKERQKKEKADQLEKTEAQAREDQRNKALERMKAQLGGESGSGKAAQSAAPSSGYRARIRALVTRELNFHADGEPGDPKALVLVRLGPDGRILSRELQKSSGLSRYDSAVLNAVDAVGVFPKDIDGRVPPSMELSFRLYDDAPR